MCIILFNTTAPAGIFFLIIAKKTKQTKTPDRPLHGLPKAMQLLFWLMSEVRAASVLEPGPSIY